MYCIWSDQYTSGRVSVNTMNDLSIKPIIFRARIREYINKFKKLLYVNYMYVTSHPLAEEIQIFFLCFDVCIHISTINDFMPCSSRDNLHLYPYPSGNWLRNIGSFNHF